MVYPRARLIIAFLLDYCLGPSRLRRDQAVRYIPPPATGYTAGCHFHPLSFRSPSDVLRLPPLALELRMETNLNDGIMKAQAHQQTRVLTRKKRELANSFQFAQISAIGVVARPRPCVGVRGRLGGGGLVGPSEQRVADDPAR